MQWRRQRRSEVKFTNRKKFGREVLHVEEVGRCSVASKGGSNGSVECKESFKI